MKRLYLILFMLLALSLSLEAQTITGVLHGGTGLSNPTIHTLLLGNGATALTMLANPASGRILTSVTGNDPAWSLTPTLGIAGTATGGLKLANATGSNVITLAAPASPAAYTFTFPADGGTSTYLLQTDGSGGTSWVAAPSGATGANPSASVGLSAVNGSASTYLRSDGAPALDQSIAPTWTGLHIWNTTNATTNAVDNILTIDHNSSGTVAANFGTGLAWNLQSTTTANRNAALMKVYWTTATDASRVAAYKLQLANNTALADVLTITGAGNGTFAGTLGASNLSGTNTGDVTLAGETYISISGQVITAASVNLSSTHATGTLAAARFGALTGDVTSAGGTYATTWAASTVLGNHYVVRETPTGTVDGANVTFTLAATPISGTELIFLNGQMMDVGGSNDYTISSATITFHAGQAPLTGDRLRVTYWK